MKDEKKCGEYLNTHTLKNESKAFREKVRGFFPPWYSIELYCLAQFGLMGAREGIMMGASFIWKCMWIWSHRFWIDIYSLLCECSVFHFSPSLASSSFFFFWLKLSRYWDFNRIPRLFFFARVPEHLWLLIYAMESDRRFIHIIALHILPSNEMHSRSAKHTAERRKRKRRSSRENVERPTQGRRDNDTVVHCSHINPCAITWHYRERKAKRCDHNEWPIVEFCLQMWYNALQECFN